MCPVVLAFTLMLFTAMSYPTAEELLTEPDHLEYFSGGGKPVAMPLEMKHYSNLTKSQFRRMIGSGIPFVVDDMAAQGFDRMEEWSCAWIADHFGGGRMQMSYGGEANDQNVGDKGWFTNQVANGEPEAVVSSGTPQFRPFYWDIKAMRDEADRPGGWGRDWRKIETAVHEATLPPRFMEPRNQEELRASPEFWFNPPGAGAKAHMDEHCIPTMAVQLSGNRTWRLGDIPSQAWGRSIESMYFDGHVYKRHPKHGFITHDRNLWRPTFAFGISAGQAMFMPPGMIHETKNNGTSCATSITFQFPVPSPAVYWRTFLPRVSRTGDLANCQGNIALLAGAGRPPAIHADVAAAWKDGTNRFKEIDLGSQDAILSVVEIERVLQGSGSRVHHFVSARLFAEDVLMYHDLNEDGVVQLEEFARNYAAWSVNMAQLQQERPIFWDDFGQGYGGPGDVDDDDDDDHARDEV